MRGNSVIDVKCDRKQIDEAISRVINMKDNIEQKLSKGYKEADIYSLDVDGGTYAVRGYFYIKPVS